MKRYFPFCSMVLSLGLSSCSQPEAEVEPDYDNMVMVDEPEWMSDEERDRKVTVMGRPDPQEQVIVEVEPSAPQ